MLFKAEEHAEDYLRELEILQKRVPELEDENEKFRAEGSQVRLSAGLPVYNCVSLPVYLSVCLSVCLVCLCLPVMSVHACLFACL